MAQYPQLPTNAVAQFPTSRSANYRTVINELTSGSCVRVGDPGGAATRWTLKYAGLTDAELASIKWLFDASEGRLSTFTFLDPTSNLLAWSEDWTKTVWSADALLAVALGGADPTGGSSASTLTNSGSAAQRIEQIIDGPGSFEYCFSLFVRSNAATSVKVFQSSGGQENDQSIASGGAWMRVTMAGKLTSTAGTISFGVELPAGASIQVFGAQVEAQPAAGAYKKTTDRAGVYPQTRFDMDAFTLSADAVNQNSCSVTLVSN